MNRLPVHSDTNPFVSLCTGHKSPFTQKKNHMTIEIEIRQTLLLVSDHVGCYRLLVFANMAEDDARQLAREYGYAATNIHAISHEALHYRHHVDDEQVYAILDRLPYQERHHPEQVLAAVRSIVPQATRIVN